MINDLDSTLLIRLHGGGDEKKGITVRKTIDVLIGTYCIEMDVALLHDDQDFVAMEEHLGLQIVWPGVAYR
ncbi:MAG: hypothetical protein D3909_07150 [Candidatus Electrothrix sp. ATG1]|nr:hypothetical protein [Candidatus Electrothrix sp. ATG1]